MRHINKLGTRIPLQKGNDACTLDQQQRKRAQDKYIWIYELPNNIEASCNIKILISHNKHQVLLENNSLQKENRNRISLDVDIEEIGTSPTHKFSQARKKLVSTFLFPSIILTYLFFVSLPP
jgi:hypothetical protein